MLKETWIVNSFFAAYPPLEIPVEILNFSNWQPKSIKPTKIKKCIMLISEAYNLRLEELQTWKCAQTDYI